MIKVRGTQLAKRECLVRYPLNIPLCSLYAMLLHRAKISNHSPLCHLPLEAECNFYSSSNLHKNSILLDLWQVQIPKLVQSDYNWNFLVLFFLLWAHPYRHWPRLHLLVKTTLDHLNFFWFLLIQLIKTFFLRLSFKTN